MPARRRCHSARLVRTSVFFFQAEDGIRDLTVTGVQTCALPIYLGAAGPDGDRAVGPDFDPRVGLERLARYRRVRAAGIERRQIQPDHQGGSGGGAGLEEVPPADDRVAHVTPLERSIGATYDRGDNHVNCPRVVQKLSKFRDFPCEAPDRPACSASSGDAPTPGRLPSAFTYTPHIGDDTCGVSATRPCVPPCRCCSRSAAGTPALRRKTLGPRSIPSRAR